MSPYLATPSTSGTAMACDYTAIGMLLVCLICPAHGWQSDSWLALLSSAEICLIAVDAACALPLLQAPSDGSVPDARLSSIQSANLEPQEELWLQLPSSLEREELQMYAVQAILASRDRYHPDVSMPTSTHARTEP